MALEKKQTEVVLEGEFYYQPAIDPQGGGDELRCRKDGDDSETEVFGEVLGLLDPSEGDPDLWLRRLGRFRVKITVEGID